MHYANPAIATLMSCLVAFGASAECNGGVSLPAFAGKLVVLANDALFFRTTKVQLDIDGSPSAYGVHDQGLEDICNGLGPLQPPECRGKNQGPCYAACQQAFSKWNREPAMLAHSMCAIGLGGGGCSPPRVRLQNAPRQEFFVSETSVHLRAPQGSQISSWIGRQEAQLDSLSVPYFVIPGRFRKLPWDATPGDIGIIVKQPDGPVVPFIVGDIGGSLDEGSAELLSRLRGVNPLPLKSKRSAMGELIDRLEGAMSGDFRVAIFRHSAPYANSSHRRVLMLDKTDVELSDFIRDQGESRLQAIGGIQRLFDCSE